MATTQPDDDPLRAEFFRLMARACQLAVMLPAKIDSETDLDVCRMIRREMNRVQDELNAVVRQCQKNPDRSPTPS